MFVFSVGNGGASETVLEVIPLFNRSASELLPLLQPALDSSDSLVSDGRQLVVKTSPERLGQIKQLLQQLDKPQQNLLITVLQGVQVNAEQLNSRAIRTYQTQELEKDSTQVLRTLSGNTAYIKTGQAYPVQKVQISQDRYGYPNVSTHTEYQPVSTGFAVVPQLLGQDVLLDIAPWSDTRRSNGQIQTQGTQSRITVKLGEWVELGAVNLQSYVEGDKKLARVWRTSDDERHILLKVDLAN
ncbi:MAG: hypothetical protein K9L60_01990 [Methylovulum sp.]|nr:hypothetical protein [Methylovulum sp.]